MIDSLASVAHRIGLAGCLGTAALAFGGESASPAGRLDRNNLLVYRDERGEAMPVRAIHDWLIRRREILAGMQAVMGPLPGAEKRVALDVRIDEEVDCGSYVRRFITYTSEPGARVPAYLLVPKAVLDGSDQRPGVLCLMPSSNTVGHKAVVGLGADTPSDRNRVYGQELAELGYVTIAPSYPLLANYHPDLDMLGYRSGTMKAIWDNIRALDLLASMPNVSAGGFGVIGHSLGGHNGIYTAVFDERIKVVVSSCGFDSFLDYRTEAAWRPGQGWTQKRYMPGILGYSREQIPFDFHELLGALAPRVVFVNAPLRDANFKWQSVDRVTAAAAQIYHLYQVDALLHVEHPDTAHDFIPEMRRLAYATLERALR